MAGEKRVSASEKRPRGIVNFVEINDLTTVLLCLPAAEFRAAGSGSAADRHRNLAKIQISLLLAYYIASHN